MTLKEKKELQDFVKSRSDKYFILITVVKTEGATYRKPGAMKIVSTSGESVGLISGGCLENDIVKTALDLKEQQLIKVYDTTLEDDHLFGYATGCKGIITLKFEKIKTEKLFDVKYIGYSTNEMIHIHLVGAGPDVDPLRDLILWNGWGLSVYTTNSDHYQLRSEMGWSINRFEYDLLKKNILNLRRSILLLCSHNYLLDMLTLTHIWNLNIPYIGLLGPEERKIQLLKELDKNIGPLKMGDLERVKGPVGLKGFGRGPTAIALSIVSEIHQLYFACTG